MIARMKIGMPQIAAVSTQPTPAERRLTDIVDIAMPNQEKMRKLRELDSYLRIFQQGLKAYNGTSSRFVPFYTPVEIEYVRLENPYLTKTDITA